MGDISTWNPVDESNTAAPPAGAPENMQPSAVNNTMRAMMGAVRRWYDTVTAQLANFLPLSGGTISGNLAVSGTLAVNGIVQSQGPSAGFEFADRAGGGNPDWYWFAQGGSAGLANGAGGTFLSVTNAGNLNAYAAVVAPAGYYVGAGTTPLATNSGGLTVLYDGAGQAAITLGAGDTYYDADLHHFRNNADVGTATIDASGNANFVGTCTAANFVGNFAGSGSSTINTGTVTATTVNASGTVTGGTITSNGDISTSSSGTLTGGTLHIIQNATIDGSVSIDNGLTVFGGVCSNLSGTWAILSDARLKEDVAPYERGLAAILALAPISFRYRDGTPFADPERTTRYGLVAQDVAGIVPEMVGETTLETGGAVATMFPGHLVYVLCNSIKELAAQNAALAARIEALEENHV